MNVSRIQEIGKKIIHEHGGTIEEIAQLFDSIMKLCTLTALDVASQLEREYTKKTEEYIAKIDELEDQIEYEKSISDQKQNEINLKYREILALQDKIDAMSCCNNCDNYALALRCRKHPKKTIDNPITCKCNDWELVQ